MAWLNYHHFFYFWTVTREGSIARAATLLRLTEPTVSAQLHALEDALGERLFRREGRGLVLTDSGRLAQRYANHIFTLGQEFQAAIAGAGVAKAARFTVGVVNVVPRLIAFQLLEPALRAPKPFLVSCESDTAERLLVRLLTHQVDAVISDSPLDPGGASQTHNRLVGDSGLTIFGTAELAARLRRQFPRSLDGAPILLPPETSPVRRALETWFTLSGIRPQLRGELSDNSLLKTCGSAGIGVFAAPSAIEREIRREYRVRVVGRINEIRERFYVISASRKAEHPAVAVISHSARQRHLG